MTKLISKSEVKRIQSTNPERFLELEREHDREVKMLKREVERLKLEIADLQESLDLIHRNAL